MPEGEVQVRGILLNIGSNYFTDQKFVLRDPATGAEIYVRPWLPLTANRGPGTPSIDGTPPVQSDFLNKEVISTGHYFEGQLRGVGTVGLLTVDGAQIVSD